MSVWSDMAHDAGARGEEAERMARMLEEEERAAREGRAEPVGLTHDELVAEVARLRRALSHIAEYGSREGDLREADMWLGAVRAIANNALLTDLTCSLCRAGHVPARPCGPVESAARSVAPWCADHVRESEESRSPRGE